MKIYKRNEMEFSGEVLAEMSEKLRLPRAVVELLFLRGMDSIDKINKFIYPQNNRLHDPFLMGCMREVADRLKLAGTNGEKVVVYGDYDADGVCACAILTKFLKSIGADVFTYVPSRSGDGYGLHIESLDKIIEEHCPDLIITCDCGISGAAEVEHVVELGVEIIVTDHHEIPDLLPDCPTLNPHLKDCGYPFEHLCGAGVAFKIVEACIGEKADEYMDLAAIATIADLVPLVDENRLIVQSGLKRLNKGTNLGLARLKQRLEMREITSTDVAFKIAPRINAAGRMGDAGRALTLLTSEDRAEIDSILDEIEEDNNLRKQVCDEMYYCAVRDLKLENLEKRHAIVLSYPDWEKGITGIVAARLAGEYKRPSFIMVRSGAHYKGTARGIEGINVYKMLLNAADILIEFGGHEQAAGFSILEENIPLFKTKIDEYVAQFKDELFLPSCAYDLDIAETELNSDVVKAIDLMEPFGNGNTRPLLRICTRIGSVNPLKSNPVHTQITTARGLNVMAFNFSHKNQILLGDEDKDLVIEAQLGMGGGVRGLLRQAGGQNLYINNPLAKANFIKMMGAYGEKTADFSTYDQSELDKIAQTDSIYGTLFIAGCEESYLKFRQKNDPILHEFIYSTSRNNYNRVIVSPDFDENLPLSLYNKVVFLDAPLANGVLDFIKEATDAQIFVPRCDSRLFLEGIELDRGTFGRYYEALRQSDGSAISLYSFYHKLSKRVSGLEIRQFVVALMVFRQLGLVEVSKKDGFSVAIVKGRRAELSQSKIYQRCQEILNN